MGIQWEKKTIKENFFPGNINNRKIGLNSQIKKRPTEDMPLTYKSKDKKLVKALLGLSSEEEWQSYGDRIIIKDKQEHIERFKSPIFFKVIQQNNTYTVYIKLEEDIPIRGRWFNIKTGKGKKLSSGLQVPREFSLQKYFAFFTDPTNFQIDTHVERKFHNTREFDILKSIFDKLQKIEQ